MEEEMGKEKGGDTESSNNQMNNQKSQETPKRTKSCKGCLYYSSTIKSNSRNPRCVGISRSLSGVPPYIVGESKMEAKGDFKYGCVGYSVFSDKKDTSASVQGTQTELPICVGFEVLLDRKVNDPDAVPAWVHNRDTHGTPQPRTHKPPHSIGDEFLSRFSRNATIVAMGVAKNLRKVGNHIKDRVDDILYPYRRRPK